jgi:hypothetical protein
MEMLTIPCSRLRHKGMYVMSATDREDDGCYDAYDATAYWCTETQKPLGPDGKPVHADSCKSGRECCQG